METAELKLKLFRYIDSLDDNHLTYVYNLLIDKADINDFWNNLTEFQKKDIEKGLNDLNEGKRKNIEEILKKY